MCCEGFATFFIRDAVITVGRNLSPDGNEFIPDGAAGRS